MFDALGQSVHFGLTRTTDATVEPLTTAEAKLFLKVDTTADDALIDVLVKAARQKVEADTGKILVNQTWTMTVDKAPSGRKAIVLPLAPVSSVTSITSYDTANASSVVSTDVYRLDTSSVPARIVLKDGQSWPSGLRPENALSIVFVVGHGAAAANVTDATLMTAVRFLVTHWYENRAVIAQTGNIAQEIPQAYAAFIQSAKVWA